jgi:hypothetical protein
MAIHRTCDGVKRRDVLKVGALGGLGLTLGQYLRLAEAAEVSGRAPAKAAIYINLPGGPTHMDTFDMKPEAPEEYRGEFRPSQSNVPGMDFCEHMPKLLQCADKFTILRGVSHTLAAHNLGAEYVNTGNRPLASLEYPGYGSIVTKEMGGPEELPPFVAIPNASQKAGYLGVQYAPMNTNSTPRAGQPFSVRGISLGKGLTVADIEKRDQLLKNLDKTFSRVEASSQLLDGLDRFSQQAYSIITSKKAREAFDISKESPEFAKQFGESAVGQSCLLATRLVESGVRFVTVSFGGWDTHQNALTTLKDSRLPQLDEALSGLLNGLYQKGLLESTAILVNGEFGRTPKINNRGGMGRDHYPRAMFMLMAGGGVKGGQVIGASDEKGTGPADKAITPDDVAASFYRNLGIDFQKEYHTNTGRPIMIVRDGKVIDGLFA